MLSRVESFEDRLVAAIPSLHRFAIKMCGNITKAEDLVQETMCKALIHKDSWTPGTNLEAWLFTLLRNHHHSTWRKLKREVEDVDDLFVAKLVSNDNQQRQMEAAELLALVNKLPPKFKDPLLLAAEGATLEEIAFEMREHIGTVKSRMNRGREMLGVGSR